MESIKHGKVVETFKKEDFPDFTHCIVLDDSPDVSYTIQVDDIAGNSNVFTVPREAILRIHMPYGDNNDVDLLCCKVAAKDNTNANKRIVSIPTTQGTKNIPIATRYVARK